MADKQQVRLGPVQQTLLITLAGRAREASRKRPLLRDPKAVEILESIEYDEETGKFGRIKEAIERVLKDHPKLASSQKGGGSPAAMKTRRVGTGDGGGQDGPQNLREEFAALGNYEKF